MDKYSTYHEDFNFWSGNLPYVHEKMVRRLSDLQDIFQDRQSVEDLLRTADPVIYEVHEIVVNRKPSDLIIATCYLMPGKIGNEFHMTRGHFHKPKEYVEVYFVSKGTGKILMQAEDGEVQVADMAPGAIIYVLPNHFHRSVNTGSEPLVFTGFYSAHVLHDYGSEQVEKWFTKIVGEVNDQVCLMDNPLCKTKGETEESSRPYISVSQEGASLR